MKQMKFKRNWIALASIFGLVALATPVFAWGGGYGMGYGAGYGMMGYGGGYGMGYGPAGGAKALSDAQQKQVNAIQDKYRPQLDELQKKLSAKYSELATARSNDSTTVGQLRGLQRSLFQLQSQYRSLLNQANSEIAQIPGAGNGSYIPCAVGYGGGYGPGYMGGMMYGGYYGN